MHAFASVAPDLWRLSLRGPDLVNVYLLGDVLVDAGARTQSRALVRGLEGRAVRAHAITHGHFDHQGGSHAVCARFGIPLWCGEGEREAIESGRIERLMQRRPLLRTVTRLLAGPAQAVGRVLREGDDVGEGFVAVETPGHTPGSLSFWRGTDRVLVIGDAAWARNPLTSRVGLREPIAFFSWDPAGNRASLRRLRSLQAELVCPGHGMPVAGEAFDRFVADLDLRT